MIAGEIDANLEARVKLSHIHKERSLDVLFLVDSGFSGYLAVPQSVVSQLSLPLATVQRGTTADCQSAHKTNHSIFRSLHCLRKF